MCKKEKTKYFLKDDGREIKFGDDIKLSHKEETPLGTATATLVMTVDENNIEKLIEYGYVTKQPVTEQEIPMELSFYVKRLAKRLDMDKAAMWWVISAIKSGMPAIAFQMLLKEIALYMESLEDTPISKRETIYCIDLGDGEIYEQHAEAIKNFSVFSAFSSKENADKAKTILSPFINILYGKQENCKCNSNRV